MAAREGQGEVHSIDTCFLYSVLLMLSAIWLPSILCMLEWTEPPPLQVGHEEPLFCRPGYLTLTLLATQSQPAVVQSHIRKSLQQANQAQCTKVFFLGPQ